MRAAIRILLLLLAGCNSDGLSLLPAADLGGACASALDEASCQARPGCLALTCPACGGGDNFLQCIEQGQPHGVICESPCVTPDCGNLADAAACDARSDCYSLYSGDEPCDSAGCSNHFEKCVAGAARCTSGPGPVSCPLLATQCVAGDSTEYLPNGCVGGCVHTNRCAAR